MRINCLPKSIRPRRVGSLGCMEVRVVGTTAKKAEEEEEELWIDTLAGLRAAYMAGSTRVLRDWGADAVVA